MSEKSPRDRLADRVVKMIFDMEKIINDNIKDDKAALELTCLIHKYAETAAYLQHSTDEELEAEHFYETEVLPKCPISFQGGKENEPEYPLKELCTLTYCKEYSSCWAARSLSPPIIDLGDYPDE